MNIENITFIEHSGGYSSRTRKNCSADATICFSVNFNSSGTRLTRQSTIEQGKLFIPLDGKNIIVTDERINKINYLFEKHNVRTLHIAGNSLYSMDNLWTQKEIDDFFFELLQHISLTKDKSPRITTVYSGGQTGADEAGAKAAAKIGIPTIVLAPNGWKFRTKNGNDISNEVKFKNRFLFF